MTPLLERFQAPDRRFFPTPIWWWSGERLDPARLRWQMERLAAGGALNLVVMNLLPTVPEMGKTRDDPALFSDRWWEIFTGVCRDAEELGVSLWLYDQIGHGGANLLGEVIAEDPGATGLVLERVVVDVDGRGTVACPPAGAVVAAAFVDRDGRVRAVEPDERGASAEGDGRLMLFYTVPRGLDFLSRPACEQLIRVAFAGFEQRVPEYLGSVIVGSFQDELPPIQNWSPAFPERFRAIAGYDLIPRLAELWEDLAPDSGRVRRDFHHVRGKLAEEAFFVPLHEWHEQHRMLSAFDQDYGARDGDPAGSSRLYGDYLRTHRWFSVPGSDHHGDAKLHSSMAHAYGHERVWIESFHSSGWGGTLEETFDWLLPWLGAGANLYDPHATYYSTHHGWWEWAPPATDWRQPYWPHHLQFARAVARLCSVLSWGTHDCDVAVLFPAATAQAALTPDGTVLAEGEAACAVYHRISGRMTWFDTAPGVLDQLGRDFDVLDDDSVAGAEVVAGTLAHHGERYRTLILPACVVLEEATARRLVEFVDGGGDLIAVGPLPASAAGAREDDAPVTELRRRFDRGDARRVERAEDLATALADAPATVRADVPTLCRRAGDELVLFVPAVFPRASVVGKAKEDPDPVFDWLAVDIDFAPDRWARERDIVVTGVRGAPQLWEPFSGRRRPLAAEPTADGVRVRVPFDDGPAALLVWGRDDELPAEPAALGAPAVLDGPWEVELEATLEDQWGDLDAPPAELPIEAWSFEHEQDGEWVPAHATFGARARWTGPAAPDALPAPGTEPHDGWRDAVWSPSRGIRKDPIHRHSLGPSGRVPEEFLRFGPVERGQAVHVRTVVHAATAGETTLVIGGVASKRAWLDGRPLELVDEGYLAHARIAVAAGPTPLDLRLTADETLDLRASFGFVADVAGSLTPDWIRVAGPARARSVVAFGRTIELDEDAVAATALIGGSGPCRVLLDGRELGRHAGYKAEIEGPRDELAYYDLGGLTAGRHELRIEVDDVGHVSPAAQADLVVTTASGELRLHSDRGWRGERDGVPVPLEVRRAPAGLISARDGHYVQSGDLAHTHLWKRPHPLPEAVWLEPDRAGADAGLAIDARIAAQSPTQRLRLTAPPGARRIAVAPAAGCRLLGLRVDGDPVALGPAAPGAPALIELPDGDRGPRPVELAIAPAPGLCGGGVLAAPIRFATGPGRVELGDWQQQGLTSHSGGVRYRRTLADDVAAGPMELDLGRVRGTAELLVDGERVGVRVCSPYRFAFAAGPGSTLEILVLNTLGPHLDAVSPSHYVLAGQTRSGLLGPVTLATGGAAREEAE
ncbi:hypothetical protein [Patulibacter defluvii]|uniref:hypothetical protein n=1 Tax=Patulibacter defluvii TaxID=3095358 RepID=UPI002A74DA29|nr:hypothetical protein [Patulibacter sp. DM4]